MAWSVADSSWAAMWWNAATTRASGPSSSCASSAAEPCGRRREEAGAPEGERDHGADHHLAPAGVLTSGRVAARPSAGTASTTMSAAAAASRLPSALDARRRAPPRQLGGLGPGPLGVAGADDDLVPGLGPAHSPAPRLPSQSRRECRFSFPTWSLFRLDRVRIALSEEVARRVAEQRAAVGLGRSPADPADDGDRECGRACPSPAPRRRPARRRARGWWPGAHGRRDRSRRDSSRWARSRRGPPRR